MGERGTAPPPGRCWRHQPAPRQRPGLSADRCGLPASASSSRPALGGFAEIDISLLLGRRGVAILTCVLVVKVAAEGPAAAARLALPRKRDLSPLVQAPSAGGSGNPGCGGLCAAFFLFFLAFGGFTAVLGALFQTGLRLGPGPLGHRLS